MSNDSKKMSLTMQIMLAMGIGAPVGILLNQFSGIGWIDTYIVFGLFHVVGAIFIAALKMMVVPLVFVSLVGGVTALGNLSALGRMSVKALVLYLFTTAVAVTIALSLATLVNPGLGFDIGSAAVDFQAKQAPPLSEVFINLVPSNPVQALAQGNMLQIIVFALLFGVAVSMSGAHLRQQEGAGSRGASQCVDSRAACRGSAANMCSICSATSTA